MRKLIFVGSDVNALDVRGDTPLTVSAGSGHLDVVRLLVDSGADLFAVNKQGLTAAMCAKKFGHKEVEQYLDQRPDLVYNRFEFIVVYRRRLVEIAKVFVEGENEPK